MRSFVFHLEPCRAYLKMHSAVHILVPKTTKYFSKILTKGKIFFWYFTFYSSPLCLRSAFACKKFKNLKVTASTYKTHSSKDVQPNNYLGISSSSSMTSLLPHLDVFTIFIVSLFSCPVCFRPAKAWPSTEVTILNLQWRKY